MAVERLRRAVAGLAAAVALLAAGAAQAQPRPEVLAACAACHGPGGNSQIALTPSLAGQPRIFIENQLVVMREGLRDVPSMKAVLTGMTDDDIVVLARHFAAQAVMPMAARVQPEVQRRGGELSRRALCGTCHLPNYAGQNQVPRLAAQNESYLLQAMKQFRDNPGPGRDTIMSASLYGLTDTDLADLAHYFASARP